MGSGKQLSFAFGEVSPSLRYRVDGSFYGQALSKAKNANVLKSGGIANRPGTLRLFNSANQNEEYFSSKTFLGMKIFSFLGSDGEKYIIEVPSKVKNFPNTFITIKDSSGSSVTVTNNILFPTSLDIKLETSSFVQLNDSAILTVEDYTGMPFLIRFTYSPGSNSFSYVNSMNIPAAIGYPAAMGALTGSGLTPADIPVSYLITQEQTNGDEVLWQQAGYTGNHPHANRSSSFQFDASSGNLIKQYNIYRSAASNTANDKAFYGLVGRIPPNNSTTIFKDFLQFADMTLQPPTDTYLYPVSTTSTSPNVRRLAYYKQRTVVVYANSDFLPNVHIEGQVGATKLGTTSMFGRPLTPNDIDAFSFTIPQDKLDKITNILVMNRLVLFTKDVTIVVRGGDNGVFTANNVNPEIVHYEGSTTDVTPVASANRGFYISSDKSKLLMIQFQADDSVSVIDISTLSDHLFKARDVRSMAIVKGKENILWIVKTDGTMISLSISEDGSIAAFSRHDTDGYIEDMTVQYSNTNLYTYDIDSQQAVTLVLSVIRDGVRYIEQMAVRDDSADHRYLFADNATIFGSYTSYPSIYKPVLGMITKAIYFNITTATTYVGGQELTLTDVGLYGTFLSGLYVGKRFDFFYDVWDATREEYYTSKIRILITAYVSATVIKGTCEEDVPAYLQDIQAQTSLSTTERKYRQARYAECFNQISGLTHLANKEVSVFADGHVISSPNNPNVDTLTVSAGGVLDLPDYYSYGYVGLPYTTEIETLDLETSDQRTFTDSGKLINSVGVGVYNTRGGFYGQTGVKQLANMEEVRTREEEYLDETTKVKNGYMKIIFPSTWEQTGRVLIKQVDPLPMTILAVYPKGIIGDN